MCTVAYQTKINHWLHKELRRDSPISLMVCLDVSFYKEKINKTIVRVVVVVVVVVVAVVVILVAAAVLVVPQVVVVVTVA